MNRIANPIETDEMCSYGCGNKAKYVNGSKNLMCDDNHNKCPAIKKKNSEGGKKSYVAGRTSYNYDELPEETKERMKWNKGKYTGTDFSYGGKGNHKKFLIEERGHICESCRLTHWLNKDITLELEHVDGDNRNNSKENLKLLCPNCHSQTETWKGKNKNSGQKHYITDEMFLGAMSTASSIRQALLKLGLTPKASNYERAYELKYGGVVKSVDTPGLSPDASA